MWRMGATVCSGGRLFGPSTSMPRHYEPQPTCNLSAAARLIHGRAQGLLRSVFSLPFGFLATVQDPKRMVKDQNAQYTVQSMSKGGIYGGVPCIGKRSVWG